MSVGWFPRFNEDGSRLTWERYGYWQAQFLNLVTEIAHDGAHLVIGNVPTAIPAGNEIAAGGGQWATCFAAAPIRVVTSWGVTLPGAGCPALSPDGVFAYVDDRQAAAKHLIVEGRVVARGAITDVRISRQALVWSDAGRTWGMRFSDRIVKEIQVAPQEFRPIPIDTPTGPWVLNHTQTGVLVRPFGETRGYRYDNAGQTYYPDGVFSDGLLHAVFSDERGLVTYVQWAPSEPRIDLTRALGTPPDPEPIPSPPSTAPPVTEDPVNKPEIDVDLFTFSPANHLTDGEYLRFHDRQNPHGAHVRVWVENGSMRTSIEYPGIGVGETGAKRPVR